MEKENFVYLDSKNQLHNFFSVRSEGNLESFSCVIVRTIVSGQDLGAPFQTHVNNIFKSQNNMMLNDGVTC